MNCTVQLIFINPSLKTVYTFTKRIPKLESIHTINYINKIHYILSHINVYVLFREYIIKNCYIKNVVFTDNNKKT